MLRYLMFWRSLREAEGHYKRAVESRRTSGDLPRSHKPRGKLLMHAESRIISPA